MNLDEIVRLVYSPQPWRKHAACRGIGPGPFYPEKAVGQSTAAKARLICAACPVREECLTDALETFDHFGVRGGMSPKERRAEGRRRRREQRDMEMAS